VYAHPMSTNTAVRYTECPADTMRDIREAFIDGTLGITYARAASYGPEFRRYNVTVRAPGGDPVWVGWVTAYADGWDAHHIDWRSNGEPIVRGMRVSMDRFARRRMAADAIIWAAT
jgi:hypothetical protein